MNTTNSVEKKCYFDYLVKKYSVKIHPKKECPTRPLYNGTRSLVNIQTNITR